MEFVEFTAGENDSGRRLDRVLRIMLRDMAGEGSVNVFSALRKRLVLVNGGKAEASAKVKCGDSIKIASFLLKKPAMMFFQVMFLERALQLILMNLI